MEKGDSTAPPILMFYQKFCGGKGGDKRGQATFLGKSCLSPFILLYL